jgi:SAM-dependent methyltransferase
MVISIAFTAIVSELIIGYVPGTSRRGRHKMGNKLFGLINRKTLEIPDKAFDRIENDAFLSRLYRDEIAAVRLSATVNPLKSVIELGAAGGNTKEIWPEVLTTDVRSAAGVDKVMLAEKLDAADDSLDLVFGLDALHHFRDPESHFRELARTLRKGGNAIYIEPNWNPFSKFCFGYLLKYLHPEPYNMKQRSWELTDPDPMMGNQCQAYNIFVRDRDIFERRFPELRIDILNPLKGLAFLFSGGVHTRLPVPSTVLLKLYEWESKSPRWLEKFGLGRIIRLTKI